MKAVTFQGIKYIQVKEVEDPSIEKKMISLFALLQSAIVL